VLNAKQVPAVPIEIVAIPSSSENRDHAPIRQSD